MPAWNHSTEDERPNPSFHRDSLSSQSLPTLGSRGASLKLAPTVTTWPIVPDRKGASQEVGIRPERKRLKSEKNEIARRQQELLRNRLHLREKRRELRDEQANAIDLETKLMQSMQLFWELGVLPDKDILANVYVSLKEVRDRLGPLEDNYDWEEDEYNALELQLVREEGQHLDKHTESGHPSTVTPVTLESEAAVCEPEHPIVNEYYSRVGDANIIHERLIDLQVEHRQLLDDSEFRDNHHIKPYPENVEFLAGVQKRYHELNTELEEVEVDIAKLGQEATEMGYHIDFRSPFTMTQPLLPSTQAPLPIKQPIFKERTPVLYRRTQSDDILPYLVSDYVEVRARISRWIFNQLRDSRLERAHYSNFLGKDFELDSIDDESWAKDFTEYWDIRGRVESFDGSWDDIQQQDGFRSQNVQLLNPGSKEKWYIPLNTHKAWKAVRDHDAFFGEGDKDFSAYREDSIRATLDRRHPYPANIIGQDLLPEYESRSV
ncbi:MAG: hypothetical protein LQ347_001843 [Umbilicaria vellea]|nr:MAG: hypothetical protein LQ347_001843 [Umbilicaria vellea]